METLSPSESAIGVHKQALDYLAAGQTDEGIRLLRSADTLETPLLPEFSVAVATLLAGF